MGFYVKSLEFWDYIKIMMADSMDFIDFMDFGNL